ncbi:hypothetical protein [Nocardia arthritidis]|uniref:hypothetical protein n=1 Tax=Nocardia arthritidis TaxID=228602 RepID=UPI0007A4786E|nr:hypothetical protein [Nocardia arthritidis]
MTDHRSLIIASTVLASICLVAHLAMFVNGPDALASVLVVASLLCVRCSRLLRRRATVTGWSMMAGLNLAIIAGHQLMGHQTGEHSNSHVAGHSAMSTMEHDVGSSTLDSIAMDVSVGAAGFEFAIAVVAVADTWWRGRTHPRTGESA